MELRRRKKDEEKQVTEEKIKQMQVGCMQYLDKDR